MYEIIKNEQLKDNTYILEVNAPLIAKSIKPGEFVIIMVDNMAERIPMAVYEVKGDNLVILYDVKGYSTNELKNTKSIFSILGPLGKESILTSNIDKYKEKRVCFIVSGTGVASIKRISLELNKNNIVNDIYYVNYNLTDENVLKDEEISSTISNYDVIYTVGSFEFMENIVNKSRDLNKEVLVSLAPLMLDGVGLCGACRVLINGNIKFACIDGPEFNGLEVDFDSAKKRMMLFKTEEGRRYLQETEGNTFKPEEVE